MVNKKQYLKDSLKGFLIFCLVYLAYKAIVLSVSFYKTKDYKQVKSRWLELQEAADDLNKNSYTWKDSVTEFINAVVISDSEFQYNFALKIDTSKYDMKKLKVLNEENLFNNFKDTSATGSFKKNNITITYNYTDTNMHPLYKIIFTPDRFK